MQYRQNSFLPDTYESEENCEQDQLHMPASEQSRLEALVQDEFNDDRVRDLGLTRVTDIYAESQKTW